jgi:ABC-2 type transport system permease protein
LMIGSILLLVYRNLVAAIDRIFLVWIVAFPIVYIFVVGYSYSTLIGQIKWQIRLSLTDSFS